MPDSSWTQSLALAAQRVLETMFFTVAGEPVDGGVFDPGASVGARLAFEGSATGTLSVRLTRASARALAADFLGYDAESVSDPQMVEVVCEFANMVCGSMVSELEDQELVRLSPAVPWDDPPNANAEGIYTAELPDGALLATVELPERRLPNA